MHGAKQRTVFKRILVGVLGSALIGGAIWLALDWVDEQRTRARIDAHVQEIISVLDLAAMPDFHHRLDKVRTFINDNSIHKLDKAFWANLADVTRRDIAKAVGEIRDRGALYQAHHTLAHAQASEVVVRNLKLKTVSVAD